MTPAETPTPPESQAKAPSHPVCGAGLRGKPGQTCRQPPVKGAKRCRLHGGNAAAGVNNGRFSHGGYSRVLPKHLREAYKKVAEDRELLTLVEDITLIQVRCDELATRLKSPETGDRWRELQDVYAAFRQASADRDSAGMADGLNKLNEIINIAVDYETAWDTLITTVERKSILQQREWRRLADLQALATQEQVRTLVRSIAESVMRNVPDENARRAIVNDIIGTRVFDLNVASPVPEQFAPHAGGQDAGGVRIGYTATEPGGGGGDKPVGGEPEGNAQGNMADPGAGNAVG